MIDIVARSIKTWPTRWLLAVVLTFLLFPGLDIFVTSLFYEPGIGFPARTDPFVDFIRKGLPSLMIGAALYVAALGVAGQIFKQTFFGVTRRVALFITLSLIVGPGLIVNLIFKENWGRARPSMIREFGGPSFYTPPLMPTDQCVSNCSFASGHGALGFWVVCFAFLAPPRWRNHAFAAALAFGSLVGLARIAQGGHFLSDVIWAGIITVTTTWLLHRWLLADKDQKQS